MESKKTATKPPPNWYSQPKLAFILAFSGGKTAAGCDIA